MRAGILCSACALVAARYVAAQTCDNSTGYYIDPYAATDDSSTGSTDSSGYSGTSGGSSGDGCNGDPGCEYQFATISLAGNEALSDIAEQGADAAAEAAGGDPDYSDDSSGPYFRRNFARLHRRAGSVSRRRSTFTCDNSQTCFVYGDLPLCVDDSTGDFTDATGGYGNLNTGEYTESAEASSILASEGATASAMETTSSTMAKPDTTTASTAKTTTSAMASASPSTSNKPSESPEDSSASAIAAAFVPIFLGTIIVTVASLPLL